MRNHRLDRHPVTGGLGQVGPAEQHGGRLGRRTGRDRRRAVGEAGLTGDDPPGVDQGPGAAGRVAEGHLRDERQRSVRDRLGAGQRGRAATPEQADTQTGDEQTAAP
jgi:hypothetical protein